MFSFTKQVFISLLRFSESLARDRTKCLSLKSDSHLPKKILLVPSLKAL